MKVKNTDLFNAYECNLICDLIWDRYLDIKEHRGDQASEQVWPLLSGLMDKVTKLSGGTNEQ